MDLKRFFGTKIGNNNVCLTDDEFYHAVKVTRHKVGYKLIVCTDEINDNICTVTDIKQDCLIAHIDSVQKNLVEPIYKPELYIGNNKDLDTVVQKAVEMGVSAVTPFVSKHCNAKNINYDRLKRIVSESSKQCGRAKLMNVNSQIDFEDVVKQTSGENTYLFYEYEADRKIKNSQISLEKRICIIIGPEGGFSEDEISLAHASGIKTYTLGKRIMRVATAVVAACALVNDFAEEAWK